MIIGFIPLQTPLTVQPNNSRVHVKWISIQLINNDYNHKNVLSNKYDTETRYKAMHSLYHKHEIQTQVFFKLNDIDQSIMVVILLHGVLVQPNEFLRISTTSVMHLWLIT